MQDRKAQFSFVHSQYCTLIERQTQAFPSEGVERAKIWGVPKLQGLVEKGEIYKVEADMRKEKISQKAEGGEKFKKEDVANRVKHCREIN